uniref:Activin_recp domain-containing protein n=1 Tax=Heterorhabditis bacteriophora TaxID=37862 RepID=A0A1I7XJV1_HETBA
MEDINLHMECCGFYGVDDFYNQATINYSRNHPKELNTLPFRVSNDWIRQCSITASSKHIRRICIVPRFCCRDPSNNKTCSSVEWKNNGDLES